MAATDQLPPMPTRGGDAGPAGGPEQPQGGGMGDFGNFAEQMGKSEESEQKQDVQEVMQKMRQDVGKTMRQFQAYAGQFPAASKEADMVQKALDQFLRAIVKNSPGPNQASPMVPA
jgi:hypothetical protein